MGEGVGSGVVEMSAGALGLPVGSTVATHAERPRAAPIEAEKATARTRRLNMRASLADPGR
jgi:hypothetical protein